ncbi:MAG: cupin domain-containing protein [Sphingomicrobium sp.]
MPIDRGLEPHVCAALAPEIEVLTKAGYRLDIIWPADSPSDAILSRNGDRRWVTTASGTTFPDGKLPPFAPEFLLTHASRDGGAGRAGMQYRDLIPSRLGGHSIASHIQVADGPVDDWVHYHELAFQLIVVIRGWVRLVYQGQGDPFVMHPGDMVLQPPGIRHRVLESGDGLEVVEVSGPAVHATFADHELVLPGGEGDRFGGQRFAWHKASDATWSAWNGGESQETAIGEASGGAIEARIVRNAGGALAVPASDGELVFGFLIDGEASLQFDQTHRLAAGDAFVIPPDAPWTLTGNDYCLLHIATRRADRA